MTLEQAIERLYDHVRTRWPSVSSAAAGFDGEVFSTPTDQPWIRVSVIPLAASSVSHGAAGARAKTCRGILWCQAFAPTFANGAPQDGVGRALRLAEGFASLFEGADIPATPGVEPVNVQTTEPVRVGTDGAWFRYDARLPFTYQQTF